MLFGVSYYHEYQPYDRLADDIRMMVAAGINYARLGDSIWALCEPVEGRIELDWLHPVLDGLHEAGIQVVLVTPTYAVPAWLPLRHPEVMAQGPDGRRAHFGGRQSASLAHPTYRYFAERIIRALARRYAAHPAVIGFQLDNETGSGLLHNDDVFDRFVAHLRDKFATVDALNEIWGLNYWSHRLTDWTQVWRPEPRVAIGCGVSGNTNPGYDLEWRRFQAGLVSEFIGWQAGIVREYLRPDQFVTQDLVGGHGRGDVSRREIAQVVDVMAENFPHATQDALAHPAPDSTVMYPGNLYGTGPAQLYQRADIARGSRPGNFFITEMNPISVGGSDNTFPAYPGQWRMAAYATISRGADMVAYWHWHSLHYGSETYSHGIVNHDLGPNRCYDELATIGADLRDHGDLLTGLRPEEEVAFLYSQDSRYAFEFLPPLKTADGSPDRSAYQHIFDRFYRGFFDARAQSATVFPDQDFDRFPIVVAPALYVADDDLLNRLTTYAEQGGHLVLTFRSGYADEFARARWQDRAPGLLRKAIGASYTMYSNLATPVPLRAAEGGPEVCAGSMGSGWADELELEGAEPIAWYDHPHFGRFPAAVSQRYGAGRVSYVGTLPDSSFAKSFAAWALSRSGITPLGVGLPEPVRVTRARSIDGRRLWFVSNWSFDPVSVPAPVAGSALFQGTPIRAGEDLRLDGWDIQVLVEEGDA